MAELKAELDRLPANGREGLNRGLETETDWEGRHDA